MRRFRDLGLAKEELRQAVDLVAFVSRYTTLQQRGERFVGDCPFHGGDSFAVSPDEVYEVTGSRGVIGCWGCGFAGDLYKFTQAVHSMEFIEAIRFVAEVVDFDLSPYYRDLTPEEQLREQQYAAMEQVADLFHEALRSSPTHLHFFHERGIEVETLERFKVGLSPSLKWLEDQVDVSVLDIMEPLVDHRRLMFDGRITYAQFTPGGQVWGWYVRMPTGWKPKYIGTSSKAPLFAGTDRLYGFAQSRQLIREKKLPFVIVEGFNDALAAQQARFPSVATCGTQLSADQVKTLQAYAIREAVVILDGDDAGADAMLKLALRAHEIHSPNLKFLRIPGDPDEFIANYGGEHLAATIAEKSLCAVEFVVDHYAHGDLTTPTAVLDFLHHIRPQLLHYPRRSVHRALGVKAVASVTGMSDSVVSDFLDEDQSSPLVNLRAEQVVLAEFALNPNAWIQYPEVQAEHFSLARYQRVFRLMEQVYQDEAELNIDLLVTYATNQREPSEVVEAIRALERIERKSQETLARDMREKALRRQSRDLFERTAREVADPSSNVNDALGGLVEGVSELLVTRRDRRTLTSVDVVTLAIQEIERKAEQENVISGLDLGPNWSLLMTWLNGLRKQRVHVIAANTGVGKSIVGLANWGQRLSLAKDGPRAPGLIVSMEMSAVENVNRMVSIDTGVPHKMLEFGSFENDEQYAEVAASFERMRSADITWMEGQKSMREIALQARILQSRGRLGYIIIDYVQLLDLSPYNDRWSQTEKYNVASQDAHALAESLDVPIIAMAQLNRTAHQADIPDVSQMGASYKIAQDAHVVYILAPREGNTMLGSLDKNRGGPDKKVVKLEFNKDPQRANLRVREMQALGLGSQLGE